MTATQLMKLEQRIERQEIYVEKLLEVAEEVDGVDDWDAWKFEDGVLTGLHTAARIVDPPVKQTGETVKDLKKRGLA